MSRLNYGSDPAMREPFYRRFYLPLQVALEAAAELHNEAFTPQARHAHQQLLSSWLNTPACRAAWPPRQGLRATTAGC